MTADTITQIGVGGILAVLLLREVLAFLRPLLDRKRNGNGNGTPSDTVIQLGEIHRIVERTDTEGTPLVYVPRSLAHAIRDLSHATKAQTQAMEQLHADVKRVIDA